MEGIFLFKAKVKELKTKELKTKELKTKAPKNISLNDEEKEIILAEVTKETERIKDVLVEKKKNELIKMVEEEMDKVQREAELISNEILLEKTIRYMKSKYDIEPSQSMKRDLQKILSTNSKKTDVSYIK
jgi:hypothetical protein